MQNKIEAGDVVMISSGGPQMTVQGPSWDATKGKDIDGFVRCAWFLGDKLVEQDFNEKGLIKINENGN